MTEFISSLIFFFFLINKIYNIFSSTGSFSMPHLKKSGGLEARNSPSQFEAWRRHLGKFRRFDRKRKMWKSDEAIPG